MVLIWPCGRPCPIARLSRSGQCAGDIGVGPCLVDENEPFGSQVDLTVGHLVNLIQDVGPALLGTRWTEACDCKYATRAFPGKARMRYEAAGRVRKPSSRSATSTKFALKAGVRLRRVRFVTLPPDPQRPSPHSGMLST